MYNIHNGSNTTVSSHRPRIGLKCILLSTTSVRGKLNGFPLFSDTTARRTQKQRLTQNKEVYSEITRNAAGGNSIPCIRTYLFSCMLVAGFDCKLNKVGVVQ